ncbi:hypothetical protein LTR84_001529 [Exophiala bonariae]|uniref:C2H2-type domain-containing protein n=1 Tax=Exophiala bonariae TaxID=1690606 RepID=A0AAV9NCU6_9EURO|nr:hypothetical protein LTR84_001529 [Exophiala bonariae]
MYLKMALRWAPYTPRSTGASSSSSANPPTVPPAIDPALTTPAVNSMAIITTVAAAPATTTTTTNNPATNPGNNPTPYTTMTPTTARATTNAPTFNANSVRANSIIPLDLEEEVIITADDEWGFRCDMCGYVRRQPGEFNRHIRDGSGGARPGFRLVAAAPWHSSGFWYGRDDNGREYAGWIALYRPPYATVDPCQENLRRFARLRRAARRAAVRGGRGGRR